MRFKEGEAWKKVFGPVFIYLNSDPTGTETPGSLWEDAKNQMRIERGKWPYGFVESKEFPRSEERGSVSGRLMVRDRFVGFPRCVCLILIMLLRINDIVFVLGQIRQEGANVGRFCVCGPRSSRGSGVLAN